VTRLGCHFFPNIYPLFFPFFLTIFHVHHHRLSDQRLMMVLEDLLVYRLSLRTSFPCRRPLWVFTFYLEPLQLKLAIPLVLRCCSLPGLSHRFLRPFFFQTLNLSMEAGVLFFSPLATAFDCFLPGLPRKCSYSLCPGLVLFFTVSSRALCRTLRATIIPLDLGGRCP